VSIDLGLVKDFAFKEVEGIGKFAQTHAAFLYPDVIHHCSNEAEVNRHQLLQDREEREVASTELYCALEHQTITVSNVGVTYVLTLSRHRERAGIC
jgi:hypothetical protein